MSFAFVAQPLKRLLKKFACDDMRDVVYQTRIGGLIHHDRLSIRQALNVNSIRQQEITDRRRIEDVLQGQ